MNTDARGWMALETPGVFSISRTHRHDQLWRDEGPDVGHQPHAYLADVASARHAAADWLETTKARRALDVCGVA